MFDPPVRAFYIDAAVGSTLVPVWCDGSSGGECKLRYCRLCDGPVSRQGLARRLICSTSCAIVWDSPLAKPLSWLWIYVRNVSDDHLPNFRIVMGSIPLRYIAIAPPDRSEWLETISGLNPLSVKPEWITACFIAVATFRCLTYCTFPFFVT